jgi:glycosyltransferase involved in cell wall biosynthesis
VEVVTHGVELPDVASLRARREPVRTELGVAPDEILLGTVANFRAQKRHGEILAIARSLVDKGLPVKFAFLGQGPLEDDIRRQVGAMGLERKVTVVGYQRDVWPYLAAFDLFLLASEYEGLPVAVMEAMAMGVPVVATAAGGLRTAVRDGVDGRLVPVDEPQRLVDVIVPLVEDATQRAAYSSAALERGSTFDISHATRHFEDLYRDAAARRHGRPSDAARSIS